MKTKSVKSNNPYKSVIQTCTMKAHGGELTVESTINKVSVLIIKLPIGL